MRKIVTIIVLSTFGTTALALPVRRGRLPKPQKCERILVSDQVQEDVAELARQVAELTGDYTIKTALKNAPESQIYLRADEEGLLSIKAELDAMNVLVKEIRANFSKSPEAVQAGITELQTRLMTQARNIQEGLSLAATPAPAPRARGVMKREVLKGLGMEGLEGLSAEEVQQELRGSSSQQQSQIAEPPPQLPNPYLQKWPPREKP